MAFKFEKLEVWELSLELNDQIDHLSRLFPPFELYALSNQMRRASYSVCLNIAEGSTGLSNNEQKRFLSIANRSSLEVVACLHLAKRRNYIEEQQFQKTYEFTGLIVRKLQSFIKALD